MKCHRAIARTLLLLPLLLAVLALAPVPASAKPKIKIKDWESIQVNRVTFPVTLSDGNVYSLVGYLYYKDSYSDRALQVAIHGGNYNHKYWDIPTLDGQPYSYARYMADEGYAVLAIDQLGAGESSHPDGDFMSIGEAALGVHQVLTALRSGANPLGHAFDSIVLVGHSLGSHTATLVQGLYNDADALVVTGATHVPYVLPIDPALIDGLVQQPYFELPPETRADLFYHAPEAEPEVITYDQTELGDVLARGFFFSIVPLTDDPAVTHVDDVTSPVLVQMGDQDLVAPASLAADEELTWTSASEVTVQVIEDMGHSFNGHDDNVISFMLIDEWIEETLDD